MEGKIDLLQFIPSKIEVGDLRHTNNLEFEADDKKIILYYYAIHSCGKYASTRKSSMMIPRFVNKDKRTFEVLGLLQAEMSKTHNRKITFANCEPNIITLVMNWFKEELDLEYDKWKWYIRLNINKPEDDLFRKELEEDLIEEWFLNTPVSYNLKYTTTVSYVTNTTNRTAANDGTLMIEFNSTIFAQIIQNLLIKMKDLIIAQRLEEIGWYMSGIIAGEGCVEVNKVIKKYTVHISASKEDERELYKRCLAALGIRLNVYKDYKETVISRKVNNFKLLKLGLMSLNPTKYAKFLEMINLYG